MVVELKGQQIRIRMKSPKKFTAFRTHDLGRKGRLQRIAGRTHKGKWETQAWRINLKDYENYKDVSRDISSLRIPAWKKTKARRIAKYFM